MSTRGKGPALLGAHTRPLRGASSGETPQYAFRILLQTQQFRFQRFFPVPVSPEVRFHRIVDRLVDLAYQVVDLFPLLMEFPDGLEPSLQFVADLLKRAAPTCFEGSFRFRFF